MSDSISTESFSSNKYNPLLKFNPDSFKIKKNSIDYIVKLNNNSNLKFFKDELSIKYIGKGNSTADHAAAQSNLPIDKDNPIFYYEVEICHFGNKGEITVGFSDKNFVLQKQVGFTSK